jgi:hypothetical protein
MKKKNITIIICCVLVAGIIFSGLAFAGSQGTGDRQSFKFKQHQKSSGLLLLAKYQQKNLMVQLLSEMTKLSAEAIQIKLKDQRMRTVMQELNIDHQAFGNRMKAKVGERIKQAVADGTITPEQEKEILAKIENRTKRSELMSKLIEKGIEDGTITPEEAQMLIMRKQR